MSEGAQGAQGALVHQKRPRVLCVPFADHDDSNRNGNGEWKTHQNGYEPLHCKRDRHTHTHFKKKAKESNLRNSREHVQSTKFSSTHDYCIPEVARSPL